MESRAVGNDEESDGFKLACDRMRQKSGHVIDDRPLVRFFYILLTNEMSAGRVESLMMQIEDPDGVPNFQECHFTNGWVAKHAQDLAERLTPKRSPED